MFKFLFGGLKPNIFDVVATVLIAFKFLFGGLKPDLGPVSDADTVEFKFLFGGLKLGKFGKGSNSSL